MTCKVIKQVTIQIICEENPQAPHPLLMQLPLMLFVYVPCIAKHSPNIYL